MDISTALAAHLAALTRTLDDPDVDLEAQLQSFTVDVQRAVASYAGMTMTIALDGHNVSFTVHNNPTTAAARSSLLIPLAPLTATDTASALLLYAATPGAFVDLAADLSHALGVEPATLVLDGHLPPPHDSSGINGLDTQSTIDQAVGVLIERGHTPEAARAELHRLTNLEHANLRAAAERVIRAAASSDPAHRT